MKTGIICYRYPLGSLRVMVADSDAVKDVMVTNAAYYVRPAALIRSFFPSVGPPRWPSGKASALRAEDPGLASCLRQDFFGVESYQ